MKTKLLGIFLMAFTSLNAHAEDLKVQTPRGTSLNVSVDRPVNESGKLGALIIAPGQGYHKELPLVKSLAQKAAAAGLVVYRFDWSYFSADPKSGQPSADLKSEVEDMMTVIRQAKLDPTVDGSRILLAGKSIGTLVSYQIFNSDQSFRGLILMTPLCSNPDTGAAIGNESYPGFAQNLRPVSLLLGNSDPMCKLPMLYDFARPSNGNITINVFNGGHSLTVGAFGDAAYTKINDANIDAATTAAALWVQVIAQ